MDHRDFTQSNANRLTVLLARWAWIGPSGSATEAAQPPYIILLSKEQQIEKVGLVKQVA